MILGRSVKTDNYIDKSDPFIKVSVSEIRLIILSY